MATSATQPPSASSTSKELVRAAVDLRLTALLAELAGVRASEPEAVHRMRVASRRLREALRLGGPLLGEERTVALIKDGRRVTRALGQLREGQVSLGLLGEVGKDLAGIDAVGFDYLALRLERRVARQFRRTSRALGGIDFDRLERRLREALVDLDRPGDAPPPPAVALVEPAAREADEELQAAHEQPDDERLHALRIGVKRLRYAVEVLAGHTPRGHRYCQSLRRLQESLGRFHDLAVLAQLTSGERARLRRRGHTTLAEAVDAARRRIVEAKREARRPLERRLATWPQGSLLERSRKVVRCASPPTRPGRRRPAPTAATAAPAVAKSEAA